MSTSAPPDPAPATESTPLLRGSVGPPQPRREAPRLAIIGQWATAIQGLVVVGMATTVFAIYQHYHPRRYYLSYDIQSSLFPSMAMGLISTAWAIANIVRVRQSGILMGPLLATIVHASLAFCLVWMSTEGAGSLTGRSDCYWYDRDGRRHDDLECLEWAGKFHILVWVYLGMLSVLALAHTIFLMYTLVPLTRAVAWYSIRREWRLPTGQFTINLTIGFLRQDRLPPPINSSQHRGQSDV